MNGHIEDRWTRPDRKGKGRRWRARYTAPDGKERSQSFDRKTDAQKFLTRVMADAQRGQYINPGDSTTVAEYAQRWAAARPHRPTTARRVNRQIRQLGDTTLGGRRLVSVLPSDVQAWAGELARTLAPSTVRGHVTLLKSIYNAAVLDRLVASSPVIKISLPKANNARVVPLTVAQVRELADEVPDRNEAMVLAQAGLGLRLGELLALRVQDVNFLGRSVRVEHQLAEGTRVRVDTKTPRSRRTVPLPEMVADALALHIQNFPPLPTGELFYGHQGRTYHHAHYGSLIFKKAVRRLATAEGSTFPEDTSTHDLRHHYASVLLAAGESVVAVAERMGHEDAGMVIRVYGHLMPDSEDRTRKAIDAAWAPAPEAATAQGRPG